MLTARGQKTILNNTEMLKNAGLLFLGRGQDLVPPARFVYNLYLVMFCFVSYHCSLRIDVDGKKQNKQVAMGVAPSVPVLQSRTPYCMHRHSLENVKPKDTIR